VVHLADDFGRSGNDATSPGWGASAVGLRGVVGAAVMSAGVVLNAAFWFAARQRPGDFSMVLGLARSATSLDGSWFLLGLCSPFGSSNQPSGY